MFNLPNVSSTKQPILNTSPIAPTLATVPGYYTHSTLLLLTIPTVLTVPGYYKNCNTCGIDGVIKGHDSRTVPGEVEGGDVGPSV